MNYRRGFQRLYGVLFASYVALFLWNAPAHQLKFWMEDDWDQIAKRYDGDNAFNLEARLSAARKAGYSNDEIIGYLAATKFDVSAARKAGYSDDQIISYLYALGRRDSLPPEKQAAVDELSRRLNTIQPSSVSVATVCFSHSRVKKLLWLVSYLVLLPGLLYFLLFHASRWVYLGFRPSIQVL